VRDFDPKNPYRPSMLEMTRLMMQERSDRNSAKVLNQVRTLFDLMWSAERDPAKIDDASLYEHADLRDRDPLEYFERGQIFVSFESDDPAPTYLPQAMGEVGKRVACFSGDYGHWDGVLENCVRDAATQGNYDRDYLSRLLAGNALALYGDRLRQSLPAYCTASSELATATR